MNNILLFLLIVFLVALVLFIVIRRNKIKTTRKKVLCIYAYYEKNQEYLENLQYFLTHGINEQMDYIVVVNGTHSIQQFPPRVRVILRENSGFDFGAYAHVLDMIDISSYTHFIFMNGSIRGPFAYRQETLDRWHEEFISLLNDEIRLVGTTIHAGNDKQQAHVQSQLFVMDRQCLEFLMTKTTIFILNDPQLNEKQHVIETKEIGMSQAVIQNGWNISCLAKKLQGFDYRIQDYREIRMPERIGGDPSSKGNYFGGDLDAREILFIKTDPSRSLPVPSTPLP